MESAQANGTAGTDDRWITANVVTKQSLHSSGGTILPVCYCELYSAKYIYINWVVGGIGIRLVHSLHKQAHITVRFI